jgi:hypothetical protein
MLGKPEFRVRGFASGSHPRVRAGDLLVETVHSSESKRLDRVAAEQPGRDASSIAGDL